MSIPSTARRKTIRARAWESGSDRIVYLDAVEGAGGRRFNIYDESGRALGFINEYSGSISTKIAGTRLVRRGRERTFWAVNGQDYWRYWPSQAEAIRRLLQESGHEH